MFTLDQYKDAAREVSLPTGVDAVRAIRDRYLDAREAVAAAESDIHAAAGNRGVALEPLYQRLAAAKDGLLQAQKEFERVGQYGTSLEAQAFANQQRKAREAEAKKQEAAQVAQNALEKAAFMEEIRPAWIACGDSPEAFERRFNAPGGLWDAHLAERVARRDREMGQAWRDRYLTMHL